MPFFKKLTILERILILLLTVSLISSLLYMYFGYTINRNALINGIDKRLLITAETLNQLIEPDFYDNWSLDDAVPNMEIESLPEDDERRILVEKIRLLQSHAELQYLYSVMKDEQGNYYLPFGCSSGYGVNYDDPSPDIIEVMKNGGPPNPRTIFDPVYGTGRAVLLRRTSPSGQFYLLGAEASLKEIDQVKMNAFLTFLCISVGSFVCVGLVGFLLARRLSRPIRRLNEFVVNLRKSNFSPEIQMPPEMLEGFETARDEIVLLAGGINQTQNELIRYVDELKTTTQSKERAESELRIAGNIQLSFLPTSLHREFPVDWAAFLRPAREAGGDLYDFFPLDDHRLFFAVGDVSGKGMSAALFMSMALTLFRSAIRSGMTLQESMLWTNNNLCISNDSCTFITLLIGIFDTKNGEVSYCNGGHNPPILRQAGGETAYLKTASNMLVGVMEQNGCKLDRLELKINDTLVIYSDGVTEAMNKRDEQFGEERFLESIRRCDVRSDAKTILSAVEHDVAAHVGDHPQSDDVTILILRRI
jgi:sigma-B regulation protein RsbU (phosphoserine phosphatase)